MGVAGAAILLIMVRRNTDRHCRALLLGVGMCLTKVWSNMVAGIVVGIVGIVVLLYLIPFIKGLK